MAATFADLARLDAILKDRPILDRITDVLNKATPLAERVTQKLELSGRKGIFPVQFGVNEGIYARADKGTFGDSQVDSPSLASVTAKFIYALFEITGPTMSATRDSAGAFEDALALTLENTVDGLKLDMARMILNAADQANSIPSGIIALVQSKTDTDTIVVDSPYGLTTYKSNVPVKTILRKNMPIDVIDVVAPPATKHHDNHSITAVTHAATGTTLDLSAAEASAPADGDYVTRAGNWGNEIDGFFAGLGSLAGTQTGTYLGIARTGNVGWQGVITDAAAGGASTVDLDPDMLRDQVDLIMENSGKSPDLIVCNFKQRRNIYNLYAPQIRYAPMVLPAGLRDNTLLFDDIPVLAERFFPPQHIGFVSSNTWYHAIDKDVEWIPGETGTVLHFKLTADQYTAVMRTYRNFICLHPAANGYLYGVTE